MLEIYLDERGEVAIENMEILLKAVFRQYAGQGCCVGFEVRRVQAAQPGQGRDPGGRYRRQQVGKSLIPIPAFWPGPKRATSRIIRWSGKAKRAARSGFGSTKMSSCPQNLLRFPNWQGLFGMTMTPDMQMMSIGFIQSGGVSQSMIKLAGMHAKGFKTKISAKSRKMMFALGFPVKKSTTTLETPARPVIDPVFRQEEGNIMSNIEDKFMASILRYMES